MGLWYNTAMKALVIADRQPNIDLASTVNQENIDLVITLGDLVREDLLGLEEVKHIPKIGVYGNHEAVCICQSLIFGVCIWKYGILRDYDLAVFRDMCDIRIILMRLCISRKKLTFWCEVSRQLTSFISHCPPRGINDEQEIAHQGFDALRKYIDEKSPRVWLHGHTYPTDEYGNTRIEYVFRYSIMEL